MNLSGKLQTFSLQAKHIHATSYLLLKMEGYMNQYLPDP